MDTDVLNHQLALVERQIIDAEMHATLRRDVLARLEEDGLSASETADNARDNLRRTEDNLQLYAAERKRIQAQMRRQLRAG